MWGNHNNVVDVEVFLRNATKSKKVRSTYFSLCSPDGFALQCWHEMEESLSNGLPEESSDRYKKFTQGKTSTYYIEY